MKPSLNPADYIFCIGKSFDYEWGASITPAKVFAQEGCMYDQHIPVYVRGWGQEMEGYFQREEEAPPAAMHDDLISQGFIFSPEFAAFMAEHGCEEVFTPPTEASTNIPQGQEKAEKIHFVMISTGYVESQSVGVLLVRHKDGFNTAEEAHKDFSKVVKTIVEQDRSYSRNYLNKECCKKAVAQEGIEFCPKCGSRTKADEADFDDIIQYVHGLMPGDLDSLGEGWQTFQNHGWEVPADMVPGRMVMIHHFRPLIEGQVDEDAPSHYCNEYSYSDIGMGKPVMKVPVERTSTEVSPGVHQVSSSSSIFASPTLTGNPAFVIGTTPCVNIPALPTGKIGTDECKSLIADLILANPGLVAKEFSPVDAQAEQQASIPKNWSRTGKEKDGKNNLREFDCKPLDDQLRAYVTDDGAKIIKVVIQGE